MTTPGSPGEETTSSEPTIRRSRWQRFSPSMGWPAFWSEILIVVLGVVIALAANEAVEDWNWRNKVRDAEARLQGDIAWVFLWSAEKSVTQPCVDAQLAAMSRNVLDSGDFTGTQAMALKLADWEGFAARRADLGGHGLGRTRGPFVVTLEARAQVVDDNLRAFLRGDQRAVAPDAVTTARDEDNLAFQCAHDRNLPN